MFTALYVHHNLTIRKGTAKTAPLEGTERTSDEDVDIRTVMTGVVTVIMKNGMFSMGTFQNMSAAS